VNFEAALKITCTDGFDSLSILIDDLPFFCCGVTTDLLLKFSVTDKELSLLPKFSMDYACVNFDIGVDFSDDHTINGFTIYGLSVSYDWSDCLKFTSDTSFSSTYHKIASPIYGGGYVYSLVPAIICSTNPPVTLVNEVPDGLYKVSCVAKERYTVWEKFAVDVCLPGCCGGEVKFNVTTYFGDHEVLKAYAWSYYVGPSTTAVQDGKVDLVPGDGVDTVVEIFEAAGVSLPTPTTTLTSGKAYLYQAKYYVADTNALFNWAKTSVALTIPATDAINIKASFVVTAFGWDSFDIGFTFKF